MQRGWTRNRGGAPRPLVRSPIPERPEIHQIVLPLSPAAGRSVNNVQIHLIEGDPLTLIDTGSRFAASRAVLESALEELGYGLTDIERVILTHAHSDHMGLVQSIRDAGASLECWVHADDAAVVEGQDEVLRTRSEGVQQLFREQGLPSPLLEWMDAGRLDALRRVAVESQPTSVERTLGDGDLVAFKHFGLVVRHSPGHTPGHILLEDEESRILFTGDQVMEQAIPNTETHYLDEVSPERADRMLRGGGSGSRDQRDALRRRDRFRGLLEMRRSLRRLRTRRFKRLLPAYGGVVQRSERAIGATLLYYDVRIHRIDRGLRHLAALGQDVTAYEIWRSLFPRDAPYETIRDQLLLVIGALDCLEDEGKLETRRRHDGVLIHQHA